MSAVERIAVNCRSGNMHELRVLSLIDVNVMRAVNNSTVDKAVFHLGVSAIPCQVLAP